MWRLLTAFFLGHHHIHPNQYGERAELAAVIVIMSEARRASMVVNDCLKFSVFKGQDSIEPARWVSLAKLFQDKAPPDTPLDSAVLDFAAVDLDGNGLIDHDEFDKFVKALEHVVGLRAISKLLEDVSGAHNDEDDWRANLDALTGMFGSVSGEKDHVTFEDLRDLLQHEKPEASEEELLADFSKVNKAGDGKLTKAEFCDLFVDIEKIMEVKLDMTKGGLVKSCVFARLRPFSTDGTGHAADSEEVDQKIEKFDASNIWLTGKKTKKTKKYDFAKSIFLPEASQQDVYEGIMADLFPAWSVQNKNVMLFAYGQTGTGKTHTMFGSTESLQSDAPHPDWGLFPRLVHGCIQQMDKVKELWPTVRWKLCASGLEFYLGMAFDLLYEKVPVMIGPDSKPVGANYMVIEKVSDLKAFIEQVYNNRTVASTAMNKGSSRSHCGLILTLHQAGDDADGSVTGSPITDAYSSTSFTLFDLAGSERVGKTGGKRMNAMEAIGTIQCGKPLPKDQITGAQGTIINYELSMLSTEVIKAADCYTNKKKYAKPKTLVTDTVKVVGGVLDGHAVCGMIICISQAPSNGWETWFSCEMAEQLAKLKAPSIDEKIRLRADEIKGVQKKIDTAEQELAKNPNAKFAPMRKGMVYGMKRYLEILETLGPPS